VTGSNGKFNPGNAMTRAAFVLVLWRFEGKPNPTSKDVVFSDVTKPSLNYYDAVKWAYENKIVTGSNGKFNPNGAMARQTMALILYRYYKYKGGDTTLTSGDALDKFTDKGSVSSSSREAMRWAVTNGLITGSGNKLTPTNVATRSASVLVLYRYNNTFGN